MSKIRVKGVVESLRLDWRSRLRALIYEPGRTMIIFPAATAVMVLSVLPDWYWPYRYLVILVGVAASAAALACLRVALFDRLPRWSIHLDMCAGTLIVSVLAAIGPTGHVNFAQLYIWFALYASLYLRPPTAVIYMVVLTVGPDVDRPVIAWFTTFGAAAVSATAVLGLVAVLNKASREDPLTGLPNRRSWSERLNEELERARRNQTAFSIASIDVDNFKQVNDTKGHQAGDRLLRRLADGWRSKIRGSGDFLARLGGDEFGLLSPGADQMEIRNIVARLNEVSPDNVSCSIGVATWDGSETTTELFRRADDGMYQVKTEHRAR